MKKYLLILITLVGLLSLITIGLNRLDPATADDTIDYDPLDIVVVFDVSGSMDFETTCFDCWEPNGDDVIANPWPSNGNFNPLPDITNGDLCSQTPIPEDHFTGKYFVHEAEHYSRDYPHQGWRFDQRQPGQGFWVIQRVSNRDASGTDERGAYLRPHPFPVYSQSSVNNYPQLQGAAYNNECFNGVNLSGACWAARANDLGESPPPSDPPYIEYDFTPDWSGETHVWIRAQGAGRYGYAWNGQEPSSLSDWRKAIFWQLGRADNTNWSDVQGRDFTNLATSNNDRLADSNKWRWLKLGSVATVNGVQHTLRLYQGSAGFNLDKIILTNFDGGDVNTTIAEDGDIDGNSSGITTSFRDFLNENDGQGPAATDGSATREACNVCNPVFGQTVDPAQCSCKTGPSDNAASSYGAGGSGVGCTQVLNTTNQLNNDLFHDEDPIRNSKEAVKNFATQLDPKIDQLGLVAYSHNVINNSNKRTKLQCLKWAAVNDQQGLEACYNLPTGSISYTNVIRAVEIHDNSGGTNIAEGIREGLEELGVETPNNSNISSNCSTGSNDKRVCDRGDGVQKVLILTTDGVPNRNDFCPASNLWQGTFGQGNKAFDCAIYYGQQAAENEVALFTIGLGPGVNSDLLAAMATGTDPTTGHVYFERNCGDYFPVSNFNTLDSVYDQIETLARDCSEKTVNPQIASASGYNVPQLGQLTVDLIDHQSIPHDIYLVDNAGATYPLCLNVLSLAEGDLICSLPDMPLGVYQLYSVVAGSQNPWVAVAPQVVVVLADTGGAQIFSVSGYANRQVTDPLQVYLANHPAGFSYDIYLKNDSNTFQICSAVKANAQKQAEESCSLSGVSLGFYDLISVVHGTIWPPVAESYLLVEIVTDDPAPALTISKSGPATAAPNEVITYKLTVSNNDPVPMVNIVISDTLPAGATYLSGGDLSGQVVRWTVASLEADQTETATFTVKATQTITNSDYGVQAKGGYAAQGQVAVVTTLSQPTTTQQKVFLPTLLK